jgi:hypothetical protein
MSPLPLALRITPSSQWGASSWFPHWHHGVLPERAVTVGGDIATARVSGGQPGEKDKVG